MRDIANLLSLPATLLTLSLAQCAHAQERPWPYNLPRTAKYYPEDEAHVKRGLEAQERLAIQTPAGVKKMGHDPGEKFYFEYWDFGPELDTTMRRPTQMEGLEEYVNATSTSELLAPFAPHTNHDRLGLSLFGRNIFGRDFKCPSGTNSCSNIGSDLCCNSGETCVNTSNGVGCCPNGQTCGDTVAGCDTGAGYTSCPNSDDGGCCVPGAVCYQSGCAFYGTLTSRTTLPAVTVTSGTSFTQGAPSTTSIVDHTTTMVISPSGYTTTVTISQQGSTVTETVVSPTTIVIVPATPSSCSSGFSSCASSLGSGCCRDGQTCATNSCIDPSSSSTATAAQPVRPTTSASSSNSPVSVADTTVTSSIATSCPTGYYMCSAVYLGGCCQVDRNCDTTSCPSTASTDVVTSGLTIAAGGSAAAATCATGWTSCAANVGGGCCPSGYNCGTASCGNPQGGGDQAKQTPSSIAVVTGCAWSFLALALTAAVGMIWL